MDSFASIFVSEARFYLDGFFSGCTVVIWSRNENV